MPLSLLQSLMNRARTVPNGSVPVAGEALPELPVLPAPQPVLHEFLIAGAEVVIGEFPSPAGNGVSQDAWLAMNAGVETGLLAVADGLGGHRAGGYASQLMVKKLQDAALRLQKPRPLLSLTGETTEAAEGRAPGWTELQVAVTESIDSVNRELLRKGAGAATTLAVVELRKGKVRTCHAGDTEVLVVSQRGRIKYRTPAHSPVGYAQRSGLLSEAEAMYSPERHIVDNVIGSLELRIELGPRLELASRDTVLIASDGLFDNIWTEEIVEIVRKGALAGAVRQLAELASSRMVFAGVEQPHKPDDLTLIAFRMARVATAAQRFPAQGCTTTGDSANSPTTANQPATTTPTSLNPGVSEATPAPGAGTDPVPAATPPFLQSHSQAN